MNEKEFNVLKNLNVSFIQHVIFGVWIFFCISVFLAFFLSTTIFLPDIQSLYFKDKEFVFVLSNPAFFSITFLPVIGIVSVYLTLFIFKPIPYFSKTIKIFNIIQYKTQVYEIYRKERLNKNILLIIIFVISLLVSVQLFLHRIEFTNDSIQLKEIISPRISSFYWHDLEAVKIELGIIQDNSSLLSIDVFIKISDNTINLFENINVKDIEYIKLLKLIKLVKNKTDIEIGFYRSNLSNLEQYSNYVKDITLLLNYFNNFEK